MKTIKLYWLFFLLLAACAVPPPPEEPYTPPARGPKAQKKIGPEIRIGILDKVQSAEFMVDRDFVFTKMNGSVLATGTGGVRWRIQVREAKPAKKIFRLVAASMSSPAKARKKSDEINSKGLGTVIEPFFAYPDSQFPGVERMYRIYLKPEFDAVEDARAFRDSVADRQESFVVTQIRERSEGTVELLNLQTGEKWIVPESFRIRGANVTVFAVPVGNGFHWESTENTAYPETLEFRIGPAGGITVVNSLPLEKYLQGVVPSEMFAGFPLEALKAQAIAARSRIFSQFGGNAHSGDPFDYCDEVHCQVYSGLSKRTPMTDRAVEETTGMVLWHNGKVCDAVFHGVCGGHGEDARYAWVNPVDYLEGNFDGSGLRRFGNLTGEPYARNWINSAPPCWCNTTVKNTPAFFDYTRKYFRWQVRISRTELESSLSQAGVPDVGSVRDLFPEARGSSGRIIRLRITGDAGETVIRGELKIRRALSSQTLWSSCFYVEKGDGYFIIRGAGWGHGVGMCQTGAGGMAWKGKKVDSILRQYYRGAHVKRMY